MLKQAFLCQRSLLFGIKVQGLGWLFHNANLVEAKTKMSLAFWRVCGHFFGKTPISWAFPFCLRMIS